MKPKVKFASESLAKELSLRGADVSITLLPTTGDGKVGLDDFIVAELGQDNLPVNSFAALNRYKPDAITQILKLNQRVVLIEEPPSYLWVESGQLISKSELQLLLDNEFIKVSNTLGTKKVKAEKIWRESPLHAKAKKLTWIPGARFGLNNEGSYNSFEPLTVNPRKSNASLLRPYHRMLDRLFENRREERAWLENLVAHKYANLNIKVAKAIVLIGPQGAGKTLLGSFYKKLFAPHSVNIAGARLTDRFNELASRKLLVTVDELMQPERWQTADYIKKLIDQEDQTIERKHVNAYQVPDRTTYFISSNHPDPVYIKQGERRFFITHILQSVPLNSEAPLDPQLMKDFIGMRENPEAVAALGWYLLQRAKRTAETFDPHGRPLMTEAKEQVIRYSGSHLTDFCRR